MDDDRRDLHEAAERFDAYLDAILGEERPSPDTVEDRDEAEMARTAAELAAAARAGEGADPDPAFVDQLRLRMRAADEAFATVRTPPPVRERPDPGGLRRWRLTRREALRAGLGAAAGLAIGATGVALSRPSAPGAAPDRSPAAAPPLVSGAGAWSEVATVADLPEGAVVRFRTPAFDGFVVNDGGTVRGLVAACTHMGCTLQFRPERGDLRCPCHGASFDLAGRLANGSRAWEETATYPGDSRPYPIDLPDLARPQVKVEDGRVWVWTAELPPA
jgi:nitrite reductase/ring-hydroxylating ferredoxin subunit